MCIACWHMCPDKIIVFKIYNSSRSLCVPWGNLISPFSISTEGGLKKFPILCQRRVLDSNSGETSIGFFGCQQVLRAQFPLHHHQIIIDWLHNNIIWYEKTLYCYIYDTILWYIIQWYNWILWMWTSSRSPNPTAAHNPHIKSWLIDCKRNEHF